MNYKELYNRTRKLLNGKITEVNELEIYTDDLRKENISLENHVKHGNKINKYLKAEVYHYKEENAKLEIKFNNAKNEVQRLKGYTSNEDILLNTVPRKQYDKLEKDFGVLMTAHQILAIDYDKIKNNHEVYEKDINKLIIHNQNLKNMIAPLKEEIEVKTEVINNYDCMNLGRCKRENSKLKKENSKLKNEMAKLENLILEYYKGAENLYIESGGTNA